MSSRRAQAPPKPLPTNIAFGLSSLISGNEGLLSEMLDKSYNLPIDDLLLELQRVMQVNGLSPEMMLSTYMPQELLAEYCRTIHASEKGGPATLAARIIKTWSSKAFKDTMNEEPLPTPKRKRTEPDTATVTAPAPAAAVEQKADVEMLQIPESNVSTGESQEGVWGRGGVAAGDDTRRCVLE